MDIRNFFGAKASAKKKPSAKSSKAKEDDDSKKRKTNDEVQEVSPQAFFSNSSKPSSPKKKPKTSAVSSTASNNNSSKPTKSTSSVAAAAAAKKEKKRIQVEVSDNDDMDEDFNPVPTKANDANKDILLVDSDDEDEKPSPSPKKRTRAASPKKKTAAKIPENEKLSPSPKKKTRAASPRKTTAAKTPSPPKKSLKAASPKTPKMPVLEPSLELDSFDSDSIQVGEFMQGLTFVFTGVLPNLHRDDAIDLVKILGARVTGAVSGKTSFLVCGPELEDGRDYTSGSKYRVAMEKKVQVIMGEKQLFGLCHLYHERAKKEKGITSHAAASSTPSGVKSSAPSTSTPAVMANPYAAKKATPPVANPYLKTPVANPYAKKSVNPYAKPAAANPYVTTKNPYGGGGSSKLSEQQEPLAENKENRLWVDRHAPQGTQEILGNKENVNKLRTWLNCWEKQFNNPKASGKTFSNPRGPWKAALLSGPPGIGKTTTATLVAKEAGRDLIEFNASDVRSKKSLQNGLGDITGSQALNFGPAANKKQPQKKKSRCIIMDEVDGMGAGDRSGMAELIQMIKKSKVPIICICNDRQSQKMKSLLPYCMDLRFRRPTKSIMANRALRIAKLEGLDVERNAAEAIAESCGNDVRQVLNCLQMWAQKKNTDGSNSSLTYKGLKEREKSINKDEILRVSLFDAAKTLVEGRRGLSGADAKAERDSIFKRSDAFFVDYSLTGLLVQQNYPKVMVTQHRKNDSVGELAFLERMHDAAASMSDYAVAEHEIRSGDLNWSLLPTCSMLAVKTGYHAGGQNGGSLNGFPEFTAWMGKNSSKNKKQRLINELHYHMNFKISGDSQGLRQDYLPVFRQHLLSCFQSDGATAEAIALMDEYGLSREDVLEKLDEFKMSKGGPSFSDLDSKQKAAFTREYNKGSHKSQALVIEQGGGATGKKKKRGKRERDPADLDAIDEDGDDDDSDEEEEDLKKLQEKFKKKGRAAKKKNTAASKKKGKKK